MGIDPKGVSSVQRTGEKAGKVFFLPNDCMLGDSFPMNLSKDWYSWELQVKCPGRY